jgi:hypothetical protein
MTFDTAGVLPRFVTPQDVRDLKNRTDPFVRALDAAVAACGQALPGDVRIGWTAFSKAWRSYYDEADSWWHTAAQMDQGEKYEEDLAHWQERLASLQCGHVPGVTPLDVGGDDKSPSKWQGTIKVAAVAGAVIAAAIAIHSVTK